jgi:hypothetical protein
MNRKDPTLLKTLFVASAMVPCALSAAIVAPYAPDANTVQLWSFDEAAGVTSAANDVSGGFDVDAVNILNGSTTVNSGILGATSFSGFGNAANTNTGGGDDGLIFSTPTNSTGLGISDAFTIEALVNTSSITDSVQKIVTIDSSTDRSFHFEIRNTGTLRFQYLQSGNPNREAAIPTSGPDAFVADEWFHVAVTYNGSAGAADSLKLYWTRLDSSRTQANEIGSLAAPTDLNTTTATFVLGNEARTGGNEPLTGLLDEVRISDIARGADDMMFAVPEPATYAMLAGLGALGLVLLRRRKA